MRRLLFAVFFPQDTVNALLYLLRFLYLVFQRGIAAGELFPLGGQLLLKNPNIGDRKYLRRVDVKPNNKTCWNRLNLSLKVLRPSFSAHG